MNYRRDIDGLRAVAVGSVILFHAGFKVFSGGFVGVDIFFVISGFLITSIILEESRTDSFSIAGFYERRARRILPALFLVFLVSIIAAYFIFLPYDLKRFSKSLIASCGFISNIIFFNESGYFDSSVELKPLVHTWSLSIEEQFYLILPTLLILTRKLNKKTTALLFIATCLASLLYADYRVTIKPSAAFFLIPSRFWELLLGSILAFHFSFNTKRTPNRVLSEFIGLTGLLFILYSVLMFDKQTPFPSLYSLIPTTGAALIILSDPKKSNTGKLLSCRPLVGLGLISYSTYLWHQPILAFARYSGLINANQCMRYALVAASIVAGYLSWKYIERPFRNKKVLSRKQIFNYSLSASLIFIAMGAIAIRSNGFESYYLSHRLSPYESSLYQLIKNQTGINIEGRMYDNGDCNFWSPYVDENIKKRFKSCEKKYKKAIIILGDSHAMNLFNIIAKTKSKPFLLGLAKPGCRPYENNPHCQYSSFEQFLNSNKTSIDTIIFHQSGSYLFNESSLQVQDSTDIPPRIQVNLDRTYKISGYLKHLENKTKVIWMGPFVESRVNFNEFRQFVREKSISNNALESFKWLDQSLKEITRHKHIEYVSLVDLFEIKPDFLMIGSCITYNDADHFSACGEDILAKKLGESNLNLLTKSKD